MKAPDAGNSGEPAVERGAQTPAAAAVDQEELRRIREECGIQRHFGALEGVRDREPVQIQFPRGARSGRYGGRDGRRLRRRSRRGPPRAVQGGEVPVGQEQGPALHLDEDPALVAHLANDPLPKGRLDRLIRRKWPRHTLTVSLLHTFFPIRAASATHPVQSPHAEADLAPSHA